MPTVKDIAKKCGVSQATVSRAFMRESSMKQATRDMILSEAAEMGYTPNFLASGLKSRRTKTIGLIIPSIDNPFYLGVLKSFGAELKKTGYKLIVNFIQHGVNEEADVLDTMFSLRVDGLIFSPRDAKNETQIKNHNTTPILQLFTAQYPGLDSVLIDDVSGTYALTKHLFANGHKKILYIGGDNRVEGFRKAFSETGQTADNNLISLEWAKEETIKRLIIEQKPTAILAVARQAEYTQRVLSELSLKIPENISFVAFDDMFWHEMLGITAAAHDLDEVAKTAVEMLVARIEKKSDVPERKILSTKIIERKSVKNVLQN